MVTMSLRSKLTEWLKSRAAARERAAEKGRVKSFHRSQQEEGAFDTRDRGTRLIPLDRIVGSVGRYNDFDARFRIQPHLPEDRLEPVRQALKQGKVLPPVKLYQIKNEYYVLDGNHRIAALKEAGHTEVKARIIEFIPSKKSLSNLIYREKAAFDDVTQLTAAIELTEPGQYGHLIRQIERHQSFLEERTPGISMVEAALDWYRTIYCPLVAIIDKGGLSSHFPRRTLADLYVFISVHQWETPDRRMTFGIGISRLVPQDMEAFRAKMASLEKSEYPEMLRDITAFVLMNVEARKEIRVVEKLITFEEVREVHSVHGNVDVLVKVVLHRDLVTSDAETIGNFVHHRIRHIPGVISTQTLIPGFSRVKEADE